MTFYAGLDMAINHAALVVLNDKTDLVDVRFFTNKKTYAKKYGQSLLAELDTEDAHLFDVNRLNEIKQVLQVWMDLLLTSYMPCYVGLEDYALGMSRKAHQMGEVGGVARLALWESTIPFRLHDPSSVKIFATGKGNADKEEMKASYATTYATTIPVRFSTGLPRETEEDIFDALTLARMVMVEDQLRRQAVRLVDLPGNETRVFQRVTGANPVNILGREWIRFQTNGTSTAGEN